MSHVSSLSQDVDLQRVAGVAGTALALMAGEDRISLSGQITAAVPALVPQHDLTWQMHPTSRPWTRLAPAGFSPTLQIPHLQGLGRQETTG